jgi:para-nitrobenzyl esterase
MTIAQTRSGKVEGTDNDGVFVFKGIPYAAPPIGSRRWLPPQREEAWDGVRDATRFSPICAQAPSAMQTLFGAGAELNVSEDALYLNVWTPGCDDARRPVMVWIHGGAFILGSGDTPWYHGDAFAKHGDVVVVTLNYRLGAFGFLHLADQFGDAYEGSGNAGILDQVAALEWVRENIASFGGNPDDVTIFGESAGGGSVGTLLGLPAARGLYQKAIPQSGASSWWATRERAAGIATMLLDGLGVKAGDTDALHALTTEQLVSAMAALSALGTQGGLPFQPVVDGTSLPQPPLQAIEAGNAAGVHLLTGTNRHEATLFNLMLGVAALPDDAIATRLGAWFDGDAATLVASYRARRPDAVGLDLWTDISSDAMFRIPAISLAETQRAHAPVWMYMFTWESPAFGGVLKATHALEIPFVFDALDAQGASMFTGEGTDRQAIADAMHQAWIAFARTGDPNHSGLPDWPQYEPGRRATMRFDTTIEVLDDPLGEDRVSWGGYRR